MPHQSLTQVQGWKFVNVLKLRCVISAYPPPVWYSDLSAVWVAWLPANSRHWTESKTSSQSVFASWLYRVQMGHCNILYKLYIRCAPSRHVFSRWTEPFLPEGTLCMPCVIDELWFGLDQSLLWLEPDHPIVISRLVGIFLCALPAVRELYQYVHDPRFNADFADE